MKKTKSYSLTGIDPNLWKEFKAACAHYGISIRETLIEHMRSIVRDYDNAILDRKVKAHQDKKGGK